MAHTSHLLRHVPYNATSADDAQAVALVLGEAYVPILETPLLTNCPSCLNGLGRCRGMGVRAQHLAVALAERLSGPDWKLQVQDPFRCAHRMPLY